MKTLLSWTWRSVKFISGVLGTAGRAIVALIGLGVLFAAAANYTMTQGAGTTFASAVIGGVNYVEFLICDATVGATQCAAVTASNALKVDGSAVTQPVSGTVTANAGTNLNTSALATSANQTNKTQLTQLTDGTLAATGYTAYGTAPSGSVPGVNGFITNTVSTNVAQMGGTAISSTCVSAYGTAASGNCPAATVFVSGAAGTALGTALSGITGSPVLDAAYSSEPTKCTTADTCWPMVDLVGKTVTSPYANRENYLNCAQTITTSAQTTITGCGAQGASVKIYMPNFCITRNDAGTTAVTATWNDVATSSFDIPANGGGGGICPPLNVPLVFTANVSAQVTMSSPITSIHVTAGAFKGY